MRHDGTVKPPQSRVVSLDPKHGPTTSKVDCKDFLTGVADVLMPNGATCILARAIFTIHSHVFVPS